MKWNYYINIVSYELVSSWDKQQFRHVDRRLNESTI
jgi:hypothetical protein